MESKKLKGKSQNITRFLFLAFAFLLFTSLSPNIDELQKYCKETYGTSKLTDFIYVSISEQKLYLFKNNSFVKVYPVSTSKYGIGTGENSMKTPLGLHYIRDKNGAGTPIGGILVNGRYTGAQAYIEKEAKDTGKDEVTTRILWLMGCEHGSNRGKGNDSYCRKIYIHGTPEEGLIGRPASHGCVRMKNTDVIDLYGKTTLGMYVLIK
ncbi:MAG: L,D-transpeptidase family protein [Flavobacteriales bacterium]